jgi:GNAT superfamily N-acetyltransferase
MRFQYRRELKSGIVIVNTDPPRHADQLGAMQALAFPTLDPDELFIADHFYKHVELFAEGQFTALYEDQPVGSTTTIRYHFDFDDTHHTFAEMIAGGWATSHQPDGDWMYGLDISVHPGYRRMGIATGLYYARQETVRRLGLKGQLAGGMLIGYDDYRQHMTPQEYFEKVKRGELYDPTISTQMRVGFMPLQLLPDYISDPRCDGYGVLIHLPPDEDVESE